MNTRTSSPVGTLDRRAFVTALLADRRDLLVVSGLGSATYDLSPDTDIGLTTHAVTAGLNWKF